ncbi:MAG: DUF2752 domain-containing protein [Chitinophagales bacterium]|nr:DUF2752 domain-containing protein [Chitinophagales bacterium]
MKFDFELLCWIAALMVLAISNPAHTHYTICPFHLLGFPWCPGCGLGHSISYLFKLDFTNSFNSHPLGIFAVVVLVHRIFILSIKQFKIFTTK